MKKVILFIKRKLIKFLLKFKHRIGIQTTTFNLNTGERFTIRNVDQLGSELITEEFFEPKTQELILDIVKEGMVVLDIGANIGFYTVKIANKVGAKGKVISFEPNPDMVNQLSKNIQLNKFGNVLIQPLALSDTGGTIQFHCPPPGYEGHGSMMSNSTFETKAVINVQTEKLDDVLDRLNVKKVDFIKIDVEGAERKIFGGATKLLSTQPRPVIIFECAELTCNAFGHRVFDVLAEVVRNGYVVEEFDYSNWMATPLERLQKK